MDWNLKAASWCFTGLQRQDIPNIDANSGSSSLEGKQSKGNFSVDLKLGQVIDSGNELVDNVKVPSIPKPELTHSGTSKRARAMNNGIQIASCLVDGCNADLSSCREYHRRHKVCEVHSKTPVVTICGHKKRFCQQCSRFHSLEEFDEGKRSCRKRLEGHNRRRRKPQPDPLSRPGSYVSSYQGTRLLPFSNPQLYPTTTVASPIWAGAVKRDEDVKHSQWHLHDKQNTFPGSCSNSDLEAGKQLAFLQGTNLSLSNQNTSKASIYQPLVNSIACSESGGGGGNYKVFCDGLTSRGVHSDCALSLLSSSPTQSSSYGLSYMMQQPNQIPTAHHMGSGLHCNNLESVDTILVPNAGDSSIHCPGMFQTGTDASSDNDTPQTLPFYWE